LDYSSYINERDKDKSYSKRFEVLQEFNSGLSINWLPDSYELTKPSKDLTLRRDRWVTSLKGDMYIEEAVNILEDLNQDFDKILSLNQEKVEKN
jgi:carboxyl-terminal processing protease